jgi:hypothetical protein
MVRVSRFVWKQQQLVTQSFRDGITAGFHEAGNTLVWQYQTGC